MILITYLLGSPSPWASLFVFVSPWLAIDVVDLWSLKGNCLQRWVFDFLSFPIMTYFPSGCLAQHLHAHNWVHMIIYWEKWGGGANGGGKVDALGGGGDVWMVTWCTGVPYCNAYLGTWVRFLSPWEDRCTRKGGSVRRVDWTGAWTTPKQHTHTL